MIVVALDQSLTNTAAAILIEKSDGKLVLDDVLHIKPKCTGVYRIAKIRDWFVNLINKIGPSIIIRELHNHRMIGAGNAVHELNGVLDQEVFWAQYVHCEEYLRIPATVWKKFITGKGNTGKDTAYLLKINKALRSLDFFESHFGDIEDDNAADAVCLGITGWAMYHHRFCDDIKLSKEHIKLFNKAEESAFDYGKEK